jgi:hypothetical protein
MTISLRQVKQNSQVEGLKAGIKAVYLGDNLGARLLQFAFFSVKNITWLLNSSWRKNMLHRFSSLVSLHCHKTKVISKT